jgi:hypothetical protein
MVDFDLLASGFCGGGTHSAVPRLYRFRTVRVYLPAGFAAARKALSHEPLTQN